MNFGFSFPVEHIASKRLMGMGILVILAFIMLSVTSCGLENYPYLYPAVGVSSSKETTLDFRHNNQNDSTYEFFGYEVFYRIYESEEASSTDAAYIEPNWDSVSPDVIYARLKAKKYVRVIAVDAQGSVEEPPLVSISKESKAAAVSLIATLGFTEQGELALTGIQLDKPLFIRRQEYDVINSRYRTFGDFSHNLDGSSPDWQVETPSTGNAYLRAYVLAYGFDTTRFLETWSQPVRLGSGLVVLSETDK